MEKKDTLLITVLSVILMVGIISAGADYYVFAHMNIPEITDLPKDFKIENFIIRSFKKIAPIPRIIGVLSFLIFFLFFDQKDAFGRRKEFIKPSKPVFIASLFVLLAGLIVICNLHKYSTQVFEYGAAILYAILLVCVAIIGLKNRILLKEKYGIHNDTIKRSGRYSVHLRISNNMIKGWVNLMNLFQGTLVVGGAGAGKSRSVFVPLIQSMLLMGFTGFVYDLKFNDFKGNLTRWVIKTFKALKITDRKLWIVNFIDLPKTHRVNPIAPEYLNLKEFCSEYSLAFIKNMDKQYVKNLDFWGNSAYAIFSSVMWFLKQNEPDKCTLPHCISIVLNDYNKVMDMVMKDPDCKDMIISVETARQEDAGPQLAGAFATLQVPLAKMSTPNLYWVLSGNDFSLDLNDPKNPGVLCIGNYQDLPEIYSPVISTIATVIMKRVNKPERKPFFYMIDEAPTLYIPGLETLPNTGRSNDIAVQVGVQDYSQLDDQYGRDKARVLRASLSNIFNGFVNDDETAEKISKMFGKESVEIENRSRSPFASSKGGMGMQTSYSYSMQEKERVRATEIMTLRRGEFVGKIADAEHPYFKGKMIVDIKKDEKTDPEFNLDDFIDFGSHSPEKIARMNYDKIKREVEEMLEKWTAKVEEPEEN